METLNLTFASVLACFLSYALLFGGEGLWAKSQSSTFEMTSDVLYGTGGKSQSATLALLLSITLRTMIRRNFFICFVAVGSPDPTGLKGEKQ